MQIQALLQELYERYQGLAEGNVARYIPELARFDPKLFAIGIMTTSGDFYGIGDVEQHFTLQSMSKPFTYGLVLEERGRDEVLRYVGVEPTGQSFNSIILDEKSGRAYNPMVNSGAIAVASLIRGADAAERSKRMLHMFSQYAGRALTFDLPTFLSERENGHRNRAIAHLMKNFNMLEGDLNEALELYFQQCSVLVNIKDIATMAATLAHRGINPITQQQALQPKYVRDILSVMLTCGMYDMSGWWAYRIGIPSKSGVSGGIWGVVPNRMGIAVFSPPLNEHGHSVRGIQVFTDLADQLRLHVFEVLDNL
ncbi:MAG: glutaminase A [Phototrophicales bacterium]|nr:MAG: glutaminase A [Phototrophicales bacterium]